MSACPVPDCDAVPKPGHLMCLAHWRTVPKKIQTAVYSTWRNFRNDPDAYGSARRDAIDAATPKPEDLLL